MNMKKTLIFAALLLLTLAVGAQEKLTILYTNDCHSAVMPLSANLNDTLKANRGGMLRRLYMVNAERRKTPCLLLFDSGDFSQGSAYYSLFKGEVEVGLMNRMGYDAAALGNHEFDSGLDNLKKLAEMATFPFVCANYDFGETPLASLIKPYAVIERDGVRVGVFGLSPRLSGLVSRQNYEGIEYNDPVEAAKAVVETLRNKEKCDVVVCLSHLGFDMGDDVDDKKVAAATTGIDLILGGHSHTFLKQAERLENAEGKTVVVDQNGKNGINVGKAVITLK